MLTRGDYHTCHVTTAGDPGECPCTKARSTAIARLKQWVADTGDKFAIPED